MRIFCRKNDWLKLQNLFQIHIDNSTSCTSLTCQNSVSFELQSRDTLYTLVTDFSLVIFFSFMFLRLLFYNFINTIPVSKKMFVIILSRYLFFVCLFDFALFCFFFFLNFVFIVPNFVHIKKQRLIYFVTKDKTRQRP